MCAFLQEYYLVELHVIKSSVTIDTIDDYWLTLELIYHICILLDINILTIFVSLFLGLNCINVKILNFLLYHYSLVLLLSLGCLLLFL